MSTNDNAFRQIAQTYLQEYSAQLRGELDALDQTLAIPTPALDRRVEKHIAAIRRARRLKLLGGLSAACLVLALMTPALWRQFGNSSNLPDTAGQPAPTYEVLPLSFPLPAQFSVASVEQDLEKTVYSLADTMQDPVVMTMERKGDTAFFDTLTPITVAGQTVYGHSGGGYNLLAFEKQDILYVMTCGYDINTLTDLSRGILI